MESMEKIENMEKMENVNQRTWNTLFKIQNTLFMIQNTVHANQIAQIRTRLCTFGIFGHIWARIWARQIWSTGGIPEKIFEKCNSDALSLCQ